MATPRKTKAKKKAPPVARKTKAAAPKRPPPKPKVAAKKKADAKVRTPKRAEPKPKAKAKKQVRETPARKKAVPAKAPRPRLPAKAAKPRPPAKPKPAKVEPKPAKVKPKPAKVEPKPAKVKPAKPTVDRALRKKLREALVSQRERLLAVVQSAKAQMAAKQTDLADVSDRASEGYGDELAVGLMAIEAAQLEDIETAIRRIDDRSYGLCTACGKPIPRPRLEVLPFVRRCLDCEGLRERGSPSIGTYADNED